MLTPETAPQPENRKVTGWAAADITLSPHTLQAVAESNDQAAFPVSGDAKHRPLWMVLGCSSEAAFMARTESFAR